LSQVPMTASVSRLMSAKVVTVTIDSTVFEVAREILNHDIGCVIVLQGNSIVGIVTKGDILREVIMKRLDPQKVPVEMVMTKPVTTIGADENLYKASEIMSRLNITKLPVRGKQGELAGIISSTDIIRRAKTKKLSKDTI